MINRSLLSHMEKLLVAQVECLLWLRQGSNPVPFGLRVKRFTNSAILPTNVFTKSDRNRQADRHTDRQTDRQTGRQTDRQTVKCVHEGEIGWETGSSASKRLFFKIRQRETDGETERQANRLSTCCRRGEKEESVFKIRQREIHGKAYRQTDIKSKCVQTIRKQLLFFPLRHLLKLSRDVVQSNVVFATVPALKKREKY
jgi:hypothetical protein